MKTGVIYLLLGIISFAVGIFIPSRSKTDGAPGQKDIERPQITDGEEYSPDPVQAADQETGIEDPSPAQDDLSLQIARVAPAIYAEVEQNANQKEYALLLQVLILSDPEEAAALLASASEEDLGDHKTSLLELLAHIWGTQNPDAAYSWFQQQQRLNDSIYAYLAAGYAAVDPVKALELLEFVEDGILRQRTSKEIAKRWIYKDPAGAFNWLERLAAGEMPNAVVLDYYTSMMRQYIKIDPMKAALIVEQLPSTKLRQNFTSAVVSAMSLQDLDAAMEWVKNQTNQFIRSRGLAEIVASHSYKQPEEVIDFLLNTSGSEKRQSTMLANAFEHLARQDLNQAITRMQDIRVEDQYDVAASVVTRFCANDQQAALEWVEEQSPGPVFDGAANAVAMVLIDSSPRDSLTWIGRIEDESKRADAATTLVNGISVENLAALQNDISQLNLSVSQAALIEDRIYERMSDEYSPLVLP